MRDWRVAEVEPLRHGRCEFRRPGHKGDAKSLVHDRERQFVVSVYDGPVLECDSSRVDQSPSVNELLGRASADKKGAPLRW